MRNQPPIDYPQPSWKYRHIKRNTEYLIIGVADRETGDFTQFIENFKEEYMIPVYGGVGWDVIYLDDHQGLHTRDLYEFMDGRFERIL